jgi:hypothetical protein
MRSTTFPGEGTALAYRLVEASGGFDPVAKKEIVVTRVEWCGEVDITADQAVAAATNSARNKGSVAAAFVLGLLAGGAKMRSAVFEQGEQHGFTAK